MKFCPNCGAQLPDDAAFCANCGVTVGSGNRQVSENRQGGGSAPVIPLRTNRGLLKFILLTLVTFGIYGIVVMSHISEEINVIATKHDNRSTMHYCLVFFLFSWLTLGIVPLVWMSRISGRIGDELRYRNLPYDFSAGTFWGWGFFGTLILVGPFIYGHKLFKAMNLLAEDYNFRG